MPIISAVMRLIWTIGVPVEQYFDYDSLPNLVRIFKTGEFHVRSEALAIINVVVNERELARRLVALGLAQPIVKDLDLDNIRHV